MNWNIGLCVTHDVLLFGHVFTMHGQVSFFCFHALHLLMKFLLIIFFFFVIYVYLELLGDGAVLEERAPADVIQEAGQ